MKKYEEFLEQKANVFTIIIAMICAVCMLIAIAVEMNTPVDSLELEKHYSQLEMVKQI